MLLTYEMDQAVRQQAVVPRWLYTIHARNRATGLVETACFWSGEDEAEFMIGGEPQIFVGAGALIGFGNLTYNIGGTIDMQRVTMSMLAPEVEAAISVYDLRLAPVEIHLALLDPETGALVGISRAFVGKVEEPQIKDAARGGNSLTLSLAPSARAGTRTLAAKKSAASQRLRLATDRGRDYADIARVVDIAWGGEDKNGYFVEIG